MLDDLLLRQTLLNCDMKMTPAMMLLLNTTMDTM